MFYKLIEKKRDLWLASDDCTVRELIAYIERRGKMRDAQIEAIKTYLYLKIACKNKPLWQLFVEGTFNDTRIGEVELTDTARRVMAEEPAAVALFQYSRLRDKRGAQLAPELEKLIKRHADQIDYRTAFKKIFYGVDYTDYLFSLPMGAGKTYLMAAFIYLDLHFAQNEPHNPIFAHNFMVMAPSGLKSSIVPSLKHIQEFDPSWVIPEPTATQLARLIKFETLDEQKSAGKSNIIRNPNAQKINNHQPLDDLMGLVAITNAEKVILDRMADTRDPSLFSEEELKKMEVANELRDIIGKLPHLSIFIDEVHHAADSEIKLRQVVNKWTENHTFNSVMGFSGTPYLEKPEAMTLFGDFTIRNTDLSNVVYYYPLIEGVGNFLKVPEVKFTDNDRAVIIDNGVREFLDKYRHTTYANGTCAKLAIYCSQIETLEEDIYPQVAEIVADYGMNPTDVILKYHGGNKQYPQAEGAAAAFASLDTSLSHIKIILLVQIGKEGWDCKSLTGVILPQKGACPTNMVLQTSCRCLRQVVRHEHETALIWLNAFNAEKLNRQLLQQQHITLQEFGHKPKPDVPLIDRYSRMEKLRVPDIKFYQLKVSYESLVIDDATHPAERLSDERLFVSRPVSLIHRQDLEGRLLDTYEQEDETIHRVTYHWWLQQIAKESFGTLSVAKLRTCDEQLKGVFSKITKLKDGYTVEDTAYDQARIRSLIRQAFAPIRDFRVREELLPCQASLLKIEKLTSPVEDSEKFYPPQQDVHDIIDWDQHPPQKEISEEDKAMLETLKLKGFDVSKIQPQEDPHPERTQTYHYLPYRFDSNLEREFLAKELLPIIHDRQLEAYFNGDETLTQFVINCYQQKGGTLRYVGRYVPDFLLLSRKGDGTIDRVVIIETKGEGFAPKFADRLRFMQTEFIRRNNEEFGYRRFDFLYLEDTLTAEQRRQKTLQKINDFFNNPTSK